MAKSKMLKFDDNYFKNEFRCGFHITSMMKRFWASEMEILSWVNEVCKKHDIQYIMCYGSLLGAVRHKGFIPWDDDIDIGMLRGDYDRFVDVVARELPVYLKSVSLLPGALPPKEMCFGITTGNRLNTSPAHLEKFHGCPYATGIDVFVFDKVPVNQEEYAYQDKLIRLLDRMLMLQWKVDDATISSDELSEYKTIAKTIQNELDYVFTGDEPVKNQILRLLDLACSLCEDSESETVENREQVIYYGERGLKKEYFTDRILVPYENVLTVPIPRKYNEFLEKIYGDYRKIVKFGSQHEYPSYKYQRETLYKEHQKRKWEIPEEFLEYNADGSLVVDPREL
ncbi:MAG: LicD family protein [Butyrivibrio sp.]|uniref:LicD family protein n=1 Tax=Butyrivibrio sp. TaxID=28121 RepID=UPI0025F1765E|nr:LicD family protein [Butyrivibrio sp.]MCR5773095.1 LicD family protein [Butyrivibrio sp.]